MLAFSPGVIDRDEFEAATALAIPLPHSQNGARTSGAGREEPCDLHDDQLEAALVPRKTDRKTAFIPTTAGTAPHRRPTPPRNAPATAYPSPSRSPSPASLEASPAGCETSSAEVALWGGEATTVAALQAELAAVKKELGVKTEQLRGAEDAVYQEWRKGQALQAKHASLEVLTLACGKIS